MMWDNSKKDVVVKKILSEGHNEDIALRCYSAQLIGQDEKLVLHGGGNTSVKTELVDDWGEKISVICVKGSGHDLKTIGPSGHPAIRLKPLLELRKLSNISDESMVRHLRNQMIDPKGPTPSVETLLHAFLPHKFIDHTHAEDVLSVINQVDGEERARKIVKGKLAIVPYVMPGFNLSKVVAEIYDAHRDTPLEGLVLLNHGIFTFAKTAIESYERMIYWVNQFKNEYEKKAIVKLSSKKVSHNTGKLEIMSKIRGFYKREFNGNFLVCSRDSKEIKNFVNSSELKNLAQRGPITPDHIIRTKQYPLYIENFTNFPSDIRSYIKNYEDYFERNNKRHDNKKIILDTFPRIILIQNVGLFSLGSSIKDCHIALDIYERTINCILNAQRIGEYKPLGEEDLFDMEYWSLEQAKLGNKKKNIWEAKSVWISGVSSGIGLETCQYFLEKGANVFGVDLNEIEEHNVLRRKFGKKFNFKLCDVTSKSKIHDSFLEMVNIFGGVDVVLSNAGVAYTDSVESISQEKINESFKINFFSHLYVAQEAFSFLKDSGDGEIIFNASKSTFNPGPLFGPYTFPKATVITLMRQIAVEWGKWGIRCNAINADRVNTSLYKDNLLKERANARGMSVEHYLEGNILRKEVHAKDVAEGFWHICQMKKTTGAVFPIDGGNAAAFPR